MLGAWSAENINQVTSGPRGSKTRKALGDTGLGSENAPPSSEKGVPFSEVKGTKQRRPLGYRSENGPHAMGKVGRETDSKPKQRKALGDISNAGKGSLGGTSSKLGGKQVPKGLKFSVHSDSRSKDGSSAGARKASLSQPALKPRVVARESERLVPKPEARLDEVEIAMGRTWEEEDALVQKKAEQRAAKAANPFRTASKRAPCTRNPSFPVPSSSSSNRVVEVASVQGNKGPPPVDLTAESDIRLKSAIDRMILHDLEDVKVPVKVNVLDGDVDDDFDFDLDWLVKMDDILEHPPLSPLDDGILTQELELNFASTNEHVFP